jgi:hypothetical protein
MNATTLKIAELGCGQGFIVSYLAFLGVQNIYACDLEPTCIKSCKIMSHIAGEGLYERRFATDLKQSVIPNMLNILPSLTKIKQDNRKLSCDIVRHNWLKSDDSFIPSDTKVILLLTATPPDLNMAIIRAIPALKQVQCLCIVANQGSDWKKYQALKLIKDDQSNLIRIMKLRLAGGNVGNIRTVFIIKIDDSIRIGVDQMMNNSKRKEAAMPEVSNAKKCEKKNIIDHHKKELKICALKTHVEEEVYLIDTDNVLVARASTQKSEAHSKKDTNLVKVHDVYYGWKGKAPSGLVLEWPSKDLVFIKDSQKKIKMPLVKDLLYLRAIKSELKTLKQYRYTSYPQLF